METTKITIDRKSAVAGQFYPSNPDKLQHELSTLFATAEQKKHNHVRAIICPHAGYVYSGKVAASAFNQIDGNVTYKRVFLIASSHHETYNGASVYCLGNYTMPYGEEIVDTILGKSLVDSHPEIFTANPVPHQKEHSLEVQLPFLHYTLKTDYRIVPIIIGTSNPNVCRQIAKVLKPYLNAENLFIISSDFSHYPNYNDAKRIDELTKNGILSNNPDILLATLSENAQMHIPHLATSLCGWTSVLTLLYMTTQNEAYEYHAVKYSNSGDSDYSGDKNRVVGYWGIAVTEKQNQKKDEYLTAQDKETLLDIARKTIKDHFIPGMNYSLNSANFSSELKTRCGAFVSLHKKGALRGCIGRISANMPLYEVVRQMALSAATQDPRFRPIDISELNEIDIEISVLSPLRKIDDIREIKLGKHGIFIEKDNRTGLYLPQVATGTGWSKEEFLGHCSAEKAGLGWEGWKNATIYIFTATVFSETDTLKNRKG